MATFERFEDIEAWQRARRLTQEVYAATKSGELARDFALSNQLRRAAISITSNIAEGFERDGAREFLQQLSVAKGSVGELRSQLYVALDERYLDERVFEGLKNQAEEVSRLLAGLINYLRTSEFRGTKYRQPPQTTTSNLKLET